MSGTALGVKLHHGVECLAVHILLETPLEDGDVIGLHNCAGDVVLLLWQCVRVVFGIQQMKWAWFVDFGSGPVVLR